MAEYIGWKPALTAALSKVGETIAVQQVVLTSNLIYTIPEGTPSGIVHRIAFTQDGTGGHTVTYGPDALTIDTTAGASTLVAFWPGGKVTYPSADAARVAQVATLTLPAAPRTGESVTVLADASTVLPAGIRWDSGGAPLIGATEQRVIALVWSGVDWVATYSLPFDALAAPDTTAPVAGTLAESDVTGATYTLTVTGASDERELHVQPYSFDDGSGVFSAWQSAASLAVTGKTAATNYTCQHKVRDAAGNETAGTPITVTTAASDMIDPTWTATFTMGTPGGTSIEAVASALAADNVGVTGYEVTYDGGTTTSAITPTVATFTLMGEYGTTYATTKLRALDAEANASAWLDVPSYTLAAAPTPPDLGWLASYWADDLALTDGDPVAAWDDRGGLYNAAQANAAKRPIYRAADVEFNGAPVLDFTTINSCVVTAGWSADAQPNTIVLVAAAPTPTANRWIVDGNNSTNRNGVLIDSARKIGLFAGSTVTAGASQLDPAPHLVCVVFDGTSSAAYIDDTGYNTVITPGTQGVAGLTIGARYSSNIDGFMGRVAFVGVLPGSITPQQLTDLNAWTAQRYGL